MIRRDRTTTITICALALLQVVCTASRTSEESYDFSKENGDRGNHTANLPNRIGGVPGRSSDCTFRIQFINETEAWLSCNRALWKSTDRGQEWVAVDITAPIEGLFITYLFIDGRVGWRNSASEVQRTTDGGRTWERVPLPNDRSRGEIGDLEFSKDGKHGWVAGGLYYPLPHEAGEREAIKRVYQNEGKVPRGIIYGSSDSGKSWVEQYKASRLDSLIYQLYVSNDAHIWALGDAGRVLRLLDSHWKEVSLENGTCDKRGLLVTLGKSDDKEVYDPIDISFSDSLHGRLAFRNGLLATTNDGGVTWCDLLASTYAALSSESLLVRICFAGPNVLWGLDNRGILFRSEDGGVNWVKLDIPDKFSDIFFLDATHGWVVGNTGLFSLN